MPELIDRQALIKDMCNNKTEEKCSCYPNCYPCDFSEARRIIDIQPTIEAEPVRRGRWENIPGMNNTVFCSECLAAANKELAMKYKGCPFCLARMDGGADNVD